jgi:hypothetical protein
MLPGCAVLAIHGVLGNKDLNPDDRAALPLPVALVVLTEVAVELEHELGGVEPMTMSDNVALLDAFLLELGFVELEEMGVFGFE